MHSIEVYDPTGTIEITQLYAPRLADLSGKTICELSNSSWEDRRTVRCSECGYIFRTMTVSGICGVSGAIKLRVPLFFDPQLFLTCK
ncbi:hypothetical protein ACFLX6_00720, partial [Chloroflexota bacterium]